MANTRLAVLAEEISSNTKIVNDYVVANDINLSFGIDGVEAFPSDAPENVMIARRAVREATKELNDLVTGPAEHLRWLATNYHDLSSLRWIYHFKLAEFVPLEGSISFVDLAQNADVHPAQAKSVLRHAMTNNIFWEPEVGQVAHTADSALLVRNRGVRDWVGYTTEESFRTSAKLVEASEGWASSGTIDQSAYNIAFDTPLTMFEHMAQFPDRAERFANTMTDMTSTDGYNVRHLVSGFRWNELEAGSTVVDVGGSTGHASIAIAEKATSLNFIVQDRPEIISQGEEVLKAHPDEQLRNRIKFEAHDFFTPQPARNASVYLLRFILHDHPDNIAVKILQSILPALCSGDRLVVMDGITPGPRELPKSEERIIRIMDMEMMTTFNALERERNQWESLFQAADPRLKLKNVEKPAGSINSVMEVVFHGDADARYGARL